MNRHFAATRPFQAEIEPFGAVNTVCQFVIIPPAFPSEKDVNPFESVTNPGFSDLPYPLSQRTVLAAFRLVLTSRTLEQENSTRTAYRHPLHIPEMFGSFTALPRRQSFCFENDLQHLLVKHQVCDNLFEPRILVLKLPQSYQLDRSSRLRLIQGKDDLTLGKLRFFHGNCILS